MKPWKLSELEAVLHCAVPVEAEITCVSTDTRDLPAGCLFVALRGEKFDGHAFVEQAIAAGAAFGNGRRGGERWQPSQTGRWGTVPVWW